jgi:hypothetical protein
MMSANPGARSGALACGANGFLARPYELEELLLNVERQLWRE